MEAPVSAKVGVTAVRPDVASPQKAPRLGDKESLVVTENTEYEDRDPFALSVLAARAMARLRPQNAVPQTWVMVSSGGH